MLESDMNNLSGTSAKAHLAGNVTDKAPFYYMIEGPDLEEPTLDGYSRQKGNE